MSRWTVLRLLTASLALMGVLGLACPGLVGAQSSGVTISVTLRG
jgi:hypothetical protein